MNTQISRHSVKTLTHWIITSETFNTEGEFIHSGAVTVPGSIMGLFVKFATKEDAEAHVATLPTVTEFGSTIKYRVNPKYNM